MSRFAKLILVATSLAPALGALALLELQGGSTKIAMAMAVAATLLVLLCYLVKVYAENNLEVQTLDITEVASPDKESLAFLIAYLFPIITGKFGNFSTEEYWYITGYVIAIMALTVYHSNSFHFNPILAMFGYHFYEVTANEGMKNLLITRKVVRKQTLSVTSVKLAEYVYLEVPASNDAKL